jgi:hypothetical protein
MNFTLTEIILAIGLLVSLIFYGSLVARYTVMRMGYTETLKHNKTLYELYCQSHASGMGLLESLNNALAYQKSLEEKNYKLSMENLQLKFRDPPKLM